MIRNLLRRLILWSAPEATAEGGENQDTVLVARKYGFTAASYEWPEPDPDFIDALVKRDEKPILVLYASDVRSPEQRRLVEALNESLEALRDS